MLFVISLQATIAFKKSIYHFQFVILDFTFEEKPRDPISFNVKSKITN